MRVQGQCGQIRGGLGAVGQDLRQLVGEIQNMRQCLLHLPGHFFQPLGQRRRFVGQQPVLGILRVGSILALLVQPHAGHNLLALDRFIPVGGVIIVIRRARTTALGHFQITVPQKIGGRHFDFRIGKPDVAVVGFFDFEFDVNVVLRVWIFGKNFGDLTRFESHQLDRVPHFQPIGAVHVREVSHLGEEPTLPRGSVVKVVKKSGQ